MGVQGLNSSPIKNIGPYRIDVLIGRGGSARVYRAFDPGTKQHVALKLLNPSIEVEEEFTLRFQREVEVVMGLKHEHILPILDFGDDHGFTYIVMPLCEGGSLADRLHDGRLSAAEGARLMNEISAALQYAHDNGIVHRDVKPGNILFDNDGNALLTDFGLARVNDASISLTGSAIIGTPAYISPEQARGEKINARTDQYSLGVILYQLVTEELPFHAETPIGILIKHIHEPIPNPKIAKPNIPKPIEEVILKATAKKPQNRFGSISEMNDAFQSALESMLYPYREPPPEIQITPDHAVETEELPSPILEAPRKINRWLRAALIAIVMALIVLVCPVGSSQLLTLLERVINPVVGAGLLTPETGSDYLTITAVVGTNEALLTLIAAPDNDEPNEAKFATATAIAQTLTAVGDRVFDEEATPTPDGTDGAGAGETNIPSGSETMTPSSTATWTDTPATFPSETADWTTTPTMTPSVTQTIDSSVSDTPTPSVTATVDETLTSSTTETGTPTPTSSPYPSKTPSSTMNVPATNTPTATGFVPPSKTPSKTPTITPTLDSCALLRLGDFYTVGNEVKWNIYNDGPTSPLITNIFLDWPIENERLDEVQLGSFVIWNDGDDVPPTDIDSGSFRTGGITVTGTDKIRIIFRFKRPAKPLGYYLKITFADGCVITDMQY